MSAPRGVQEVIADDGCRITVRQLRRGQPNHKPVLFIHALAMNGDMWEDVASAMQPGMPLYAVDCRGHGLSDKPSGPYTTERFAKDIVAVLDALNAPRAHIVGCSMGGTVALAVAGRFPDRVASLTVIDSTACYGAQSAPAWEERGLRAANEGFDSMVDFQLSRWFSPAYVERAEPALQEAVDVFLKNSAPAYLETCRMLGHADERPNLPNYKGPASVVVGEHDYATPPAMAEEVASLLKQASLLVLPGMRHYTPIEAPEAIALAIRSAVQRA